MWPTATSVCTLIVVNVETISVMYMLMWICGLVTFCQFATLFVYDYIKTHRFHSLFLFHTAPVSFHTASP
jgi:hypothetical protein